ncbi:MAG: hypothetical protein ACHP9Z_00910 [Streptosporangiales bacterium]
MSLPARQRRALDSIEKRLLAGDPRFGSLFAVFTRLTWHEAMPRSELVKPGRWQVLRPFAALALALVAVAGLVVFSLIAPGQARCATAAGPRPGHSSGHAAGCPARPVLMQERDYLR